MIYDIFIAALIQILGNFQIYLLIISSLILLWSKDILCMIKFGEVCFKAPGMVYSILLNTPHAIERNVYSDVGWSALQMSII